MKKEYQIEKNGNGSAHSRSDLILGRMYKPLMLLLVILVLTLGFFLVIRNQYVKLEKSRQIDLVQIKNSVNLLEQKKAVFEQYAGQAVEFSPSEKFLLSLALPEKFDFPSIVIQATTLAQKFGFLVANIEVAEPAAKEAVSSGPRPVNIKLDLAGGDYARFKDLLAGIESSVMIMDLKAVSYMPAKANYRLDLTTYYYPGNL